jgi:ABC-2 type transport system ATP-binding protein
MSEPILRLNGLTKDFGNGRGCRSISLTVGEGEVFGFLGPNGAGKSTLVKMLVGLIRPTAGSATICGASIGSLEARRQIGYLPELFRYQEWLTGEEVLQLHAKLCGMDKSKVPARITQVLDEVGIGRRGRDRVKQYSKGMQQRLGLACAVLNEPKLVFLDEPASALDPLGRREVRNILQGLRSQGITIFLNSHLLEDVELLCERVALLNNGQILEQGTVAEVLKEKTRWHIRVGGFTPVIKEWLQEQIGQPIEQVALEEPSGSDSVWLEVQLDEEEQVGRLNHLIMEQGMTIYEVKKLSTRLDEWFVNAVAGLNIRGERE